MAHIEKKLAVLFFVAVIALLGTFLEPGAEQPSFIKYLLIVGGEILLVFLAALIGFDRAKKFAFKSIIGKALAFISLGLALWGVGALIWIYYFIALQVAVPYPSIADVFYVLMITSAVFGLYLLVRNIKVKVDMKLGLKLIILPLITFILTYNLFIESKLAETMPLLEKALNIIYPLGDVIFLSFAFLLLSLTKGGKLFKPIAIISFGFILQAVADFLFSWTTSQETYFIGNIADVFFLLAFLTLGVGMFYTKDILETFSNTKTERKKK